MAPVLRRHFQLPNLPDHVREVAEADDQIAAQPIDQCHVLTSTPQEYRVLDILDRNVAIEQRCCQPGVSLGKRSADAASGGEQAFRLLDEGRECIGACGRRLHSLIRPERITDLNPTSNMLVHSGMDAAYSSFPEFHPDMSPPTAGSCQRPSP